MKLLQFDKMTQENIRLKQEMQRVFQITSAHSVVDLAEQIQQLKLQKQQVETELEVLQNKTVEERTEMQAKLELERKRIQEQEYQQSTAEKQQLKLQYDSLLNQQIQQNQQIVNQLTGQLKQLQLELNKLGLENRSLKETAVTAQK